MVGGVLILFGDRLPQLAQRYRLPLSTRFGLRVGRFGLLPDRGISQSLAPTSLIAIGNSTSIRVPFLGALSILALPPSTLARSRMPAKP